MCTAWLQPLFRRALEGFTAVLGADDRSTLFVSGNLGKCLVLSASDDEQRRDEGLALVRAAATGLRGPPHELPDSHPWVAKFQAVLDGHLRVQTPSKAQLDEGMYPWRAQAAAE